jgi:hypothetical protein
MPDLFQNLLNQVGRGYGQLDKNVFKGVLPGGASISSSIAPDVRKISQSPIYKTVRDKVAVPILDRGMEAGVVPAKEGMFARFLLGTSQPLTRVPADTKAAEALLNKQLTQQVTVDPLRLTAEKTFSDWMNASREVNSQNEMHNMYGKGSPATQQQLNQVNALDRKVNEYTKQLGLKNRNDLFVPTTEQKIKQRQQGYTPSNYVVSDYANIGAEGLGLNQEQTELVNKGLVNTLGRYKVQDGQITDERYDFNSYNVGTPLFAPGSMVGGVVGEKESSRVLADRALSLADKFGFIQPGAGYPVEFKFR